MRDRKGRAGVGLAELLIVMALMALVLAVVSLLFMRGRDGVRQSTERLDAGGRARRTMDALTPFVTSAIRGFQPALEARDSTPDELQDASILLVSTRERFLAPDYSPDLPFLPNPLIPPWRYQLRFDPGSGLLTAEQLRVTAGGGEEVDPDVSARVLGRDLDGCGFRMHSPRSVEVTLRTRVPEDDVRRPGGTTRTQLRALLAAPGVRG